MDSPLSFQVEQISASLVGLATDDVQGLAQLHAQFDTLLASLRGTTSGLESAVAQQLEGVSAKTHKSIEQLILDEAEDAQKQLNEIVQSVADLQTYFDTGTLPGSAAPSAEPTAASSEGSSHASAIEPRHFVEDELPLVQEFITEANTHLDTAEQEMLTIEDDPSNMESVNALFRAFHTIKGVAGFLDLKQIQALAHVTENLLDRGRSGSLVLQGIACELVLQSIDLMKKLVSSVGSASSSHNALLPMDGVAPVVKKLEDFLDGKLAESAPAPKAQAATESAGSTDAAEVPSEKPTVQSVAKAMGDGTVKVQTDRLDSLIDMVGELVIANSMVSQDLGDTAQKDVRLGRHMGHLGKIVRELQDLSMSLRMVEVGTVFKKMTRVVRDTARKALKEADLVIEGGDTELDRNVVEQLADPLMHMIRNAVDHGIEPPDQREAAGKPRTGVIKLSAAHKGGSIVIEIIDDGRGLNKEKILKKAIANGIVREGDVLSDKQIFDLIFAAGLSTAEKVTDISGRGVGMDVVRQNIEKLRGRVEIQSTPGKGSIFTIRLPLTLAVIDGLVVKVGEQKYILPITSIEQSMQPRPEMLSTVQGRGEIVTVRGAILPLVRLHDLFTVEPKTKNPCESLVVIVQDNDRRACFLVDELLGQEQVVIKTLGEGIGQLRGISGGAVLGDGNVSLILDVPGIMDLSR
jgi:two-component system, chemotaxis family, sensor kinase CheA